MFEKKAVIYTNNDYGTLKGKTANDLIMYSRKYEIVAVIDETRAGKDAGEVLGLGKNGIPIVARLEDSLKYQPKALIIGTAPVGGALAPDRGRNADGQARAWTSTINNAIVNGMDIVNGLHQFFSDDPQFSKLAAEHKVKLIDFRKPSPDFRERIFKGEIRKVDVPVVTILSTDLAAGKNIAIIELLKEAEKKGLNPGFVATGQTTMMIGADAGIAVDALPADFMAGSVEHAVLEVAKMGKDIIFVEGQGALSHPWAGHETLAVIYGSWPDAVILVHNPFLEKRSFFPEFDMPTPQDEIKKVETIFPETRVVGIAVNGFLKSDEEIRAACKKIEAETGLPATDCYRFGASRLFDPLVKYLNTTKKKPVAL